VKSSMIDKLAREVWDGVRDPASNAEGNKKKSFGINPGEESQCDTAAPNGASGGESL